MHTTSGIPFCVAATLLVLLIRQCEHLKIVSFGRKPDVHMFKKVVNFLKNYLRFDIPFTELSTECIEYIVFLLLREVSLKSQKQIIVTFRPILIYPNNI